MQDIDNLAKEILSGANIEATPDTYCADNMAANIATDEPAAEVAPSAASAPKKAKRKKTAPIEPSAQSEVPLDKEIADGAKPAPSSVKSDRAPALTHKQEIVKNICELHEKIARPLPTTRRQIEHKWTVAQCEKYLADLASESVQILQKQREDAKINEEERRDADKAREVALGRILLRANMYLANIAELGARQYGEPYGISLDGYAQRLEARSEELQACLTAIFRTHGDSIIKYISPETQYATLMLMTAADTVVYNLKKRQMTQSAEPKVESAQQSPVSVSSLSPVSLLPL